MKDEILKKLREAELLIMMDDTMKTTDQVKYREWVDELLMRKHTPDPFNEIVYPTKYAEYSLIRSMVSRLYRDEHNGYDYHKNLPDIERVIADVVSMTLFYKEQAKSLTPNQ